MTCEIYILSYCQMFCTLQAQITEEDGGFVGSLHCDRSDSPLLQSFVDKDYLSFETSGLDVGYNYLDTNFLPGN